MYIYYKYLLINIKIAYQKNIKKIYNIKFFKK